MFPDKAVSDSCAIIFIEIIRNAEFLRVGSFTKVKIVDANYYDLFAEII